MRSRGRSPTRADMCLETRSRTDPVTDRKSTRLNSSHDQISYAVFCLKKKKPPTHIPQELAPPPLDPRHGQHRYRLHHVFGSTNHAVHYRCGVAAHTPLLGATSTMACQ